MPTITYPFILKVTVPILFALNSCACSVLSSVAWKEEVNIHNGDSVIVERTQSFDGSAFREIGQGAPLGEDSLAFVGPSGKRTSWSSDFGRSYFKNNLYPLVLDFVRGVPYLVTYPAGCPAYNRWGRPNPPYVYFRYTEGEWHRILKEDYPNLISKPNLMVGGYNGHGREIIDKYSGTVVTAEDIQSVNRQRRPGDYRREISSEPIVGGPTSCPELVPKADGGWVSIDFFSGHPNLSACLKLCAQKNIQEPYCLCRKYFNGEEE